MGSVLKDHCRSLVALWRTGGLLVLAVASEGTDQELSCLGGKPLCCVGVVVVVVVKGPTGFSRRGFMLVWVLPVLVLVVLVLLVLLLLMMLLLLVLLVLLLVLLLVPLLLLLLL